MYELEKLMKTFKKHAEEAKKNHEKWVGEYRIDYPNDPLPKCMEDTFNLPEALHAICVEIDKLRIEIGGWK